MATLVFVAQAVDASVCFMSSIPTCCPIVKADIFYLICTLYMCMSQHIPELILLTGSAHLQLFDCVVGRTMSGALAD